MTQQVITTDQGEIDAVIELYLAGNFSTPVLTRETSIGMVSVRVSKHGIVHVVTDTACGDVMIVPSELMANARALSDATG